MAVTEGRKGAVKLGTEGADTLVAAMNSWTLTSNADRIDVTVFGATAKEYLAGFKDGELRISGFYDPADDAQADLHTAFGDGTEVDLRLYVDDTLNTGFEGSGVVLSREVGSEVAGAATCNFTIAVNGEITPFDDGVS